MPLSVRKEKLIAAIVEAYIRTGEPVGSKSVADMFDHTVSSATIRNEMAELIAMGYLEQPHTSAGRIPTAPAFRLYIDKYMSPKEPAAPVKRRIEDQLAAIAANPDTMMDEAAEALAQTTGFTAVCTPPSERRSTVRGFRMLRVADRALALVLMTGSSGVRSRVCRMDADFTDREIEIVQRMLQEQLTGKALAAVNVPFLQGLAAQLASSGFAWLSLLPVLRELTHPQSGQTVRLSGHLNLLQYTEYPQERLRDLAAFLSRRDHLIGMMDLIPMPEGLRPGGWQAVLGEENLHPELTDFSVIVAKFCQSTDGGAVGIIGPLRMDYSAAIPQLAYFARTLAKIWEQE